MKNARLGDAVRIGNTVWKGHISAIDRHSNGVVDLIVTFPMGAYHDGGFRVYWNADFTRNGQGEWEAPLDKIGDAA